jgi:hypothetical protein
VKSVTELEAETALLWEYVWAMEACNIAAERGKVPNIERLNAAQEALKRIHSTRAALKGGLT